MPASGRHCSGIFIRGYPRVRMGSNRECSAFNALSIRGTRGRCVVSERFDTRQPGTRESTASPATVPAQGSEQERAGMTGPVQPSPQPASGTGSPQVSEAEARRVAEEAREDAWLRPSFGKQLFLGDFQLGLIHPYPVPDPESEERGKAFCERLAEFCARAVNGAIIENDAKIPERGCEGTRGPGGVRHEDLARVRRPRPLPALLQPRADDRELGLPGVGRAAGARRTSRSASPSRWRCSARRSRSSASAALRPRRARSTK